MSKKISQLSPAQLPLSGNEKVPIVQNNQTVQCELSSMLSGESENAAAIAAETERATAVENSLSASSIVLSTSKVDRMVDLPSPPISVPISVLIGGTNYPALRIPLLSAKPTNPAFPYDDTDGRVPFTPDGTFDEGSFYDIMLSYSISFQEWRLYAVIEPGINSYWSAAVADQTIQNVKAWPWVAADEGTGMPTFTVSYSTAVSGVPGSKYRVAIDDGLFQHYEKQPDDSFLLTGIYDAIGNEFVDGTELRRVPAANWTTFIPKMNERVLVGDTGCTASGDGETPVSGLEWSGRYRVELNEDFLNSDEAASFADGLLSIYANSGHVEIFVTDDLPAIGVSQGFTFTDPSLAIPGQTVRFNQSALAYSISVLHSQTGGTTRFLKILRHGIEYGSFIDLNISGEMAGIGNQVIGYINGTIGDV